MHGNNVIMKQVLHSIYAFPCQIFCGRAINIPNTIVENSLRTI